MKRKTYHHGDLRSALFKACHKLLVKREPNEITLRLVADLAGVSHSAIYRHFKDKEELLEVMAAYGFQRLAQVQKRAFEREKSRTEGLIQLGLSYIKFAWKHPNYYKIMFMTRRDSPGSQLKMAQIKSYSVLVSACRQTLKEKQKQIEPRAYALMCWSMVHGYSNLCLETQFPQAEAQALKQKNLPFARQVIQNAILPL
ncbi:WHG domain protein [Leptospira ryugenii]|uniref:WHG domain protein n=1 Tax=Leptospira ryugenii TaxID=1917863 RepID=A0A2P2E4N0_9LEPT|nr:TetR/AcrR family transcriptional regulator [Leptospira ryugenii]GBF51814.1 WHG domain protein [Leptospira ryugenii]